MGKQADSYLTIWARVDPSRELEKRTIITVGTGHDCPGADEVLFIDTVVVDPFVWHVFQLRQEFYEADNERRLWAIAEKMGETADV